MEAVHRLAADIAAGRCSVVRQQCSEARAQTAFVDLTQHVSMIISRFMPHVVYIYDSF